MTDSEIAIVSAMIGAVAGGAVAYIATWHLAVRERDRQRRALATALLFELADVDTTVRTIYAEKQPRGVVPSGTLDTLVRFSEHVALFDAPTIGTLFDLRGDVVMLCQALEIVVTHPTAPDVARNARMRAWAIAQKVPAVRQALEEAGGSITQRIPVDSNGLRPDFPPLPPSVFQRSSPRPR